MRAQFTSQSSWDPVSEERRFGLAGVPSPSVGRPVLLVGNHQLLALDLLSTRAFWVLFACTSLCSFVSYAVQVALTI